MIALLMMLVLSSSLPWVSALPHAALRTPFILSVWLHKLFIFCFGSPESLCDFRASSFPEETLSLFRKAIDQYAEKNTGRNYYEHIVDLMKKMINIKGGKKVVYDMINQYKTQYKNRRAMMEI